MITSQEVLDWIGVGTAIVGLLTLIGYRLKWH